MRRIAAVMTIMGTLAVGAGSAHAAVLTSAGGTISYMADQGERNDVQVGASTILGGAVGVYSFKDADANPIRVGGGPCQLINGVGMCTRAFIGSFVINVRDRDDTVQIATGGTSSVPPPTIGALIIGGRGIDVLTGGFGNDILKGNNGRDSLRGRQGADLYKGGRGSDTLQTLDGESDTFISCGDGARDLVRADKVDPKPKSCELGGRKPGKRF